MTEQPDVEQEVIPTEELPEVLPSKGGPLRLLRRLGCLFFLVLWFTLLLTPCLVVYLATQGELVVPLGGAPNQVLRLWIVMNAEQRGIGVSTGALYPEQANPDALCVQTDVRFLLWAGEGQNVTFCECFERTGSDADWSTAGVQQGACTP